VRTAIGHYLHEEGKSIAIVDDRIPDARIENPMAFSGATLTFSQDMVLDSEGETIYSEVL
jgi:hypothetical protein